MKLIWFNKLDQIMCQTVAALWKISEENGEMPIPNSLDSNLDQKQFTGYEFMYGWFKCTKLAIHEIGQQVKFVHFTHFDINPL